MYFTLLPITLFTSVPYPSGPVQNVAKSVRGETLNAEVSGSVADDHIGMETVACGAS